MALWIVLIAMTAVAALFAVLPIFLARRGRSDGAPREIAVYADQLSEVARDVERGLIGDAEAAAARVEISRRILHADQTPDSNPAHRGRLSPVVGILVLIAIPLISLGMYLQLGSPKLPDLPLAERKATAPEKLSPEELIARLDQRLADHPDDVKGWDVAAPIYMRIGRYGDAVKAFQAGIRLAGADARRQTGLGEALTANAEGVVTADARAAFEAATTLDPNFYLPKMYLALALSQDGRFQDSVDAWKRVIAMGRGYEPWIAAARKELSDAEAKLAQQNGTAAPPSDPGMGPAGPEASGNGDRVAPLNDPATKSMIEGMVSGLAQRLNTDGGTAEEWGRLVKSYVVLGRRDAAKEAYAKAKLALGNNPAASAEFALLVGDLGLTE